MIIQEGRNGAGSPPAETGGTPNAVSPAMKSKKNSTTMEAQRTWTNQLI
jgi:hypothetical protein